MDYDGWRKAEVGTAKRKCATAIFLIFPFKRQTNSRPAGQHDRTNPCDDQSAHHVTKKCVSKAAPDAGAQAAARTGRP